MDPRRQHGKDLVWGTTRIFLVKADRQVANGHSQISTSRLDAICNLLNFRTCIKAQLEAVQCPDEVSFPFPSSIESRGVNSGMISAN